MKERRKRKYTKYITKICDDLGCCFASFDSKAPVGLKRRCPNSVQFSFCCRINGTPKHVTRQILVHVTLGYQIQERAIIFLQSTPTTSARGLFRATRLLFSNNRLRGTSILFQFIKRIALLYNMENSHRHHYSSWHFYLVPKNITDFFQNGLPVVRIGRLVCINSSLQENLFS